MYLDSKDFQTVWQLAHNWVMSIQTKAISAHYRPSLCNLRNLTRSCELHKWSAIGLLSDNKEL